MSGKSVCKKLLLEECAAINAALGKECRVEYPCTDQIPALVTCCDGMVMLNRIGNVMSQPTKIGAYTDEGYPAFAAPAEDDLDPGEDPEAFLMYLEDAVAGAKPREKYGTWRHMVTAIERELDTMFKRPGTQVVVLGFDKKQFVDGVKRITHAKRAGCREKSRATQIAKDKAAGLTPTRGIPFKFEDIKDGALVPYPWNQTLHGFGQCAALVRYFSHKLLRFYKPPRDGQVLIIDGHCMHADDGVQADVSQADLDRTPILLHGHRNYHLEFMLSNSIGEFDHTAFFYVRRLATDPGVQFVCKINPNEASSAKMHIRTNDTDTLVIALTFLERLALLEPKTKELEVLMEIPRKAPVKVDTVINARRVLSLLQEKYGSTLQYPGAYFAYGLYLKENDYDTQFMPGIGHATYMSALTNYPYAIRDIVGMRTSIPKPPTEPDEEPETDEEPVDPPEDGATPAQAPTTPPTQVTNTEAGLATPDSDDGRKCIDLTTDDAPRETLKRKRGDNDDGLEDTSDGRTYLAPTMERAFQVQEDAVTRFVAACYYDALYYRTKKQRDEREARKLEGKHDTLDPAILSHTLIEGARKRRKMGGITPTELYEKTLRHDYFVAITEDLTLGFQRCIPFELAPLSGYADPEYQKKF